MASGDRTIDDDHAAASTSGRPVPGLVVVFSGETPRCKVIALEGGGTEIGRTAAGVDDERASRRHAHVAFDGRRWRVRDLGSRNGTFLDGTRVDGEATSGNRGLVRIGHSLLLLAGDVRPFAAGVDTAGGRVAGPALRRAWNDIIRAAVAGDTLLVTGETGTGKELAARVFHEAGPAARGPFVAVNGATLSGATAGADGAFRAADKGTLFLDELGDLDGAVQGKLLRVLETREVMPPGATEGVPVDVRVCAATTRDVREAVASGVFRRELYFRIGRPEVALPPLRARVEEIPWLVAHALAEVDAGLRPDLSLVETSALAPWPGNVRELLGAVGRAAHAARAEGRAVVEARDLEPGAGVAPDSGGGPDETPSRREPTFAEVERALRAERGNVSAAARRLGLDSDELRRWLAREDLDPRSFSGGPDDGDDRG